MHYYAQPDYATDVAGGAVEMAMGGYVQYDCNTFSIMSVSV